MGGDCLPYSEISCGSNPFGNNPIKSFRLEKGYRCVFWPAGDCKETNGEPEYIDASSFPVQVDDVTYDIRSIHCSVIVMQADEKSAVAASSSTQDEIIGAGFKDTGALTTRDDPLFRPLNLYSGANLTGSFWTYEGPGCQSIPVNMTTPRSLTLAAPFSCTTYPDRDCEIVRDHPYRNIYSTNGALQIDNLDFDITSVGCVQDRPDGPPGDITSCDEPDFATCTDLKVNAMGRCVNAISSGRAGVDQADA
jgi:hypothetical protein